MFVPLPLSLSLSLFLLLRWMCVRARAFCFVLAVVTLLFIPISFFNRFVLRLRIVDHTPDIAMPLLISLVCARVVYFCQHSFELTEAIIFINFRFFFFRAQKRNNNNNNLTISTFCKSWFFAFAVDAFLSWRTSEQKEIDLHRRPIGRRIIGSCWLFGDEVAVQFLECVQLVSSWWSINFSLYSHSHASLSITTNKSSTNQKK